MSSKKAYVCGFGRLPMTDLALVVNQYQASPSLVLPRRLVGQNEAPTQETYVIALGFHQQKAAPISVGAWSHRDFLRSLCP